MAYFNCYLQFFTALKMLWCKYITWLNKSNTDAGVDSFCLRPPLTPAVQQAWGGQQLLHSPYFILFCSWKMLRLQNEASSSLWGCRAAVFKLWPEEVQTSVRQVAGRFGECCTKSERTKIWCVCIGLRLRRQGFSTQTAASISFAAAVIDFY